MAHLRWMVDEIISYHWHIGARLAQQDEAVIYSYIRHFLEFFLNKQEKNTKVLNLIDQVDAFSIISLKCALLLNPNVLKPQIPAMALYLLLRTNIKPGAFADPSLFRFYSTFNSNDDESDASADDPPSSNSKSPFSSNFTDVMKSLRQQQPTSPPSTPFKSPTSSFSPSDSLPPRLSRDSMEEIRRNLSDFRLRSSTPPPGDPSVTPSSSSPQISFQELYNRRVVGKSGESMGNADSVPVTAGGRHNMDVVRESLRQISFSGSSQMDKKGAGPFSLSAFKDSIKLKPSASTSSGISSTLIGGTNTLPASVFGKEMQDKKEGDGTAATKSKTELLRMYNHQVLGEKLRTLRPAAKGTDWFSLEELNERLIKLREMEEEKAQSTTEGMLMKELRQVVIKMHASNEEKAKKNSCE